MITLKESTAHPGITFAERHGSPTVTKGADPSAEHEYLFALDASIDSPPDINDLITEIENTDNIPLMSFGVPQQGYRIKDIGGGYWKVVVSYNSGSWDSTGNSTFSFDTGGGSQHITQSLQTVGSYAATGSAPNYKGAIGVTKDSVAGVDIVVPNFQFSESHQISNSNITDDYKAIVARMTGTVNSVYFRGYEPGEVLFQGASGSRRSSEKWEITYKFAVSRNARVGNGTALTIGDMSGIEKGGWDYLWVRYEDEEDATAKAIVKRPTAVYVERVYDESDFRELGLD